MTTGENDKIPINWEEVGLQAEMLPDPGGGQLDAAPASPATDEAAKDLVRRAHETDPDWVEVDPVEGLADVYRRASLPSPGTDGAEDIT